MASQKKLPMHFGYGDVMRTALIDSRLWRFSVVYSSTKLFFGPTGGCKTSCRMYITMYRELPAEFAALEELEKREGAHGTLCCTLDQISP